MSRCPVCGKNFEAHATAGRQEGLRLGDPAICIGCGTYLILEALPYEMRLMSEKEFHAFDAETQLLMIRARFEIEKTHHEEERLKISSDTTPPPRRAKNHNPTQA